MIKFNRTARLSISCQPTETSCGPTCLKAIYDYYGHTRELDSIIGEIPNLDRGGTLAVQLGRHALKEGFEACIYTYNLNVFDPSWFWPKQMNSRQIIKKLKNQIESKDKRKLQFACREYIKFLEAGGKIRMKELNNRLLRRYLQAGIPVLTGLSSTYLYRAKREFVEAKRQCSDDVKGFPEGHFVIMENYDPDNREVTIVDPYPDNPYSRDLRYQIHLDRLINSILLGVLTYDANIMILTPKSANDQEVRL